MSKSKIIRASEASQFNSLKLSEVNAPGFKTHKPAVRTNKPQMTAADLEKIQQQARKEAYEEGKKEGFEFGHKEAREEFRQQYTDKLKQIDALLTTFSKPFQDLDDQVEQEIVELVISMVKQLVRREVKMDPNHVIGVVREALAILPVSNREVLLHLNPDDAELIREAFSLADKEETWKIVEDPVLNRGGCKVVTEDSLVDATLESRLDALIAPLLSDERIQATSESSDDKDGADNE